MEWISCKDYATKRKDELKKEVSIYKKQPTLVVIQVDNDFASNKYIKWKKSDCEKVGIRCIHDHVNSNDISQKDLEKKIMEYDASINVHGIIIQLPIPDKYDVEKLQKCISPEKDVDGFRTDSLHKPCTPKGVVDWLKHNNSLYDGATVTVVGRSKIVGKPLINMLIDENATVTCCHSKSNYLDVWKNTKECDVLISAIGVPKHFDHVDVNRHGLCVVDIGINEDEDGNLCGDVDREDINKFCPNLYVTPVPGGTGLLTRVSLLENTIAAYKLIERID